MPNIDNSSEYSEQSIVNDAAPTFTELGVPGALAHVLASDGKRTAFPIQADTLPDSLAGRDILGRGRTGSGKTLAFSIPLVARLGASEHDIAAIEREADRRGSAGGKAATNLPRPRALVLAPTRELAKQIDEVLLPLAQAYGMTTTTVYGGVKYSRQIAELKAGAQIVVGCPGRLEDLLRQNALTLSSVECVVLDEADEMADMGFLPGVERLLGQIPADAQHMLFSATLDHGVDKVVERFLHDPKVHSVDDATSPVDEMTHHVFEITKGDKPEIVRTLASGAGKRILFTRTKFQAKKLSQSLTKQGIPCAQLHGNLNQNQRDRNLAAFETGEVNVLAATDVAARGIDVSGVELVVQVEPPEDPKAFLHRSGRTARAGNQGDVVTLVLPEQRRETRFMLRKAGIKVKPVAVTAKSPEVLELVGERAEKIDGWELSPLKKKTKPLPKKGKGRNKRGGETEAAGGRRSDAPKRRKRQEQTGRFDRFDESDYRDYDGYDEYGARGGYDEWSDDRGFGKKGKHHKRTKRDRYDWQDRDGRNDRRGRGGYQDRDDRKGRADRRDRGGRGESFDRNGRYDAVGRVVEEPRKGGKRVHKKPIRVVEDLRGEDAKRYDRRMNAKKAKYDDQPSRKKGKRGGERQRYDDNRRDQPRYEQPRRSDKKRNDGGNRRSAQGFRKHNKSKRTPFRNSHR
ncbi:MAG: DEAD/DEAH box helicase [Bifidobacterium angulatum]|nr:DEAD/DEAH box helicase [Bifidobacterium angulatum]MEE0332223.1 DEAD/DEAH box helicase [Bifidobacterium angulatum]